MYLERRGRSGATDPRLTGATIGPDPADVAAGKWDACDCPRGQRWEHCRTVPCLKGGQLACTDPAACFAGGGKPLIFPCNNNGDPLADGTCDCKQDAAAGVFFSSDTSRFSVPNCYAQRACETSAVNGLVCHQHPPCSTPGSWIRCPVDPAFNDQIDAQFLVQGQAPSNASFVRQSTSIVARQSFRLQSLLALVTATQEAISGEENCVCVSRGEDPAAPVGMRPYDSPPSLLNAIGPYGKGYEYPYEVGVAAAAGPARYTPAALQAALSDAAWYTRRADASAEGADYFDLQPGEALNLTLAAATTLHAVRVHARAPDGPPRLSFVADSGAAACAPFAVPQGSAGASPGGKPHISIPRPPRLD